MFSFYNKKQELKYIGFEDIKHALSTPNDYLIINTLSENNQDVLIKNTVSSEREEETVNKVIIQTQDIEPIFIIYGVNSCDKSVEKKYSQLISFGFLKVYIYSGGLFEWLLLQDIYGEQEFPTTSKPNDLLKYRVKRSI